MKDFRILNLFAHLMLYMFIAAAVHGATITVTNTNNSGAGSLRQAILDSNVNNQDDTIVFDPFLFSTAQTIVLTSGEIVIAPDNVGGPRRALAINGPGANLLTLDGNDHSRIFTIQRDCQVEIDGVTITNGNGTSNGTHPDQNSRGGGIEVQGGFVGELQNLTLKNSIVTGNRSILNTAGGGGMAIAGTVTIINSTINNNVTRFYGGGIVTSISTDLIVINSTISNNNGALSGGIYADATDIFLINSTVAFNGGGGGIRLSDQQNIYSNLFPRNSIVSNNTTMNGAPLDVGGTYRSLGNNIIGSSNSTIVQTSSPTDRFDIDSQLDPQLRANGAITPTHSLSAGSPAIDKGDNCVLTTTASGGCGNPSITTDQRGVMRPQDGDNNGVATVDIGSFEASLAEISAAPNVPDLRSADDTGVSSTDNITTNRNPRIDIGNVTNGATVQLFRDGNMVANTVATGDSVTFTEINLPADATLVYSARQIVGSVSSLQSGQLTVIIDNTVPTVTVDQAAGQPDPTRLQPVNFAVSFSEPVFGFAPAGVSLAGSTADVSSANISITGSGTLYNAAISNITSDGLIRASLPASAVQDAAGNASLASTSTDNSVTLDMTAPAVTIDQAVSQVDPARLLPINFTVVFSEAVTGFTNADVSLAGSTANVGSASISVTGSGATYNVAVSNFTTNGGMIQARVVNAAAVDGAGNLSLASTSTDNIVTVDNVSPTVTINQAAGQPDPTTTLPVNFTVVFSEPVTGFDSLDILFTGSTVGTSGATINITGSGTNYSVSIGGNIVSNGGILRASVRLGAANDAIGNSSIASTSGDNAVLIDNVAPTVTINQSVIQADPTSVQPIIFTVAFSEGVTGFAANDISLSGSTANVSFANVSVTGSGNIYTVSVRNVTSSGQVRASIIAGAAIDNIGNQSLASTSTDNTVTLRVANRDRLFDFDGDGKTDLSIFRPAVGEWWYLRSSDSQVPAFQFGSSNDRIAPGDWTGDGKTDLAFWRPSSGEWFILRSEDFSFYSFPLGTNGDIPVPGDYDADGKTDPAVFRPASATWFIIRSSDGGTTITTFGNSSDKPMVADYDGDSKADIGIYRQSAGEWWYRRSSDGQVFVAQFGTATDKPVPADYTGDGKTDLAFWRPSSGEWFILRSEDSSFYSFPFGTSTDIPVVGDYDGDGKSDAGVFRSSSATWFINRSTTGTLIASFGANGDQPVPSAFLP